MIYRFLTFKVPDCRSDLRISFSMGMGSHFGSGRANKFGTLVFGRSFLMANIQLGQP